MPAARLTGFPRRAIAALVLLAPALEAAESRWLEPFSTPLRQALAETTRLRRELDAMGTPVIGNTVPQLGYQHLQMALPPPESPWVQLDLGSAQRLDTIALVPALVDFQSMDRRAYGFPRRFRVDLSDDPSFQHFQPVFVHTEEDYAHSGPAPVVIRPDKAAARYLRLTVTRLAEENGTFFFALAEIMALQGNRNLALHCPVASVNSVNIAPRWNASFLTDGLTPLGPPIRPATLPEFDALFAARPAPESPPWMGVDLGSSRSVNEVRLHPLHARQGADVPGFRFPLQTIIEIADDPAFTTPRLLGSTGPQDLPNPGNNPVTIRSTPLTGRYVRAVAVKLSAPDVPDFALSEMQVYADDENISAGRPGLSSGDPSRQRPPALLTDGCTSYGRLMEWPAWLNLWEHRTALETRLTATAAALPALEADARRRALWLGTGLLALLAAAALLLTIRSGRRRRSELEQFRQRLARDLHDEIGSNLAGIAMISETAAADPQHRPEDWPEVQRIARESSEAMREVLWLAGARQEMGLDLVPQLERAAARLLTGRSVQWTARPGPLPSAWPVDARRQVFLFFKEALTNIVRHSRAREILLGATAADGWFELTVQDDGCGFDPTAPSPGLGLGSLRNRARQLGGTVAFSPAPGGGTKIILRVPLPPA